jgi:hypothetical protein
VAKRAGISSRGLICERCYNKEEATLLVLCELAELRFCELGASFVEPSYYYKAPLSKVLFGYVTRTGDATAD